MGAALANLDFRSGDVEQIHPGTPERKNSNLITPTIEKNGRHNNLDAGNPFAFRYRDYNNLRSVDPAWPIFCCNSDTFYPLDTMDDPFSDFKAAGNKMIPEAEYDWKIYPESIHHFIELGPIGRGPFHPVQTRYFFYTKRGYFRETDVESFLRLIEYMKAVLVSYTINHCNLHMHQYKFSRFERVEITGHGNKRRELSAKQLLKEKRNVMVRKLSQGRQEEIAEMERKLKTATIEEVEELATHVTFAREGEVSEVARKLSSGKAGENDNSKLGLARLNMYYSEPIVPRTP